METRAIESWEYFVESATQWTEDGPYGPNIFRGQAGEQWELTPSLTRELNKRGCAPENALTAERRILEEFQDRYQTRDKHCKALSTTDLLAWWEVMQHHSAPTRLLDWTKLPFAALFFAVAGLPDENGAFFIMDAGHLQWIQSTRAQDPDEQPNWHVFGELNKSVHAEPHEKCMVIISSPTPTARMAVQHSSFTLSTEILESHDVTADSITFGKCINRADTEPTLFYKYLIPSSLKSEFLDKLQKEGYTQELLFPDSRIIDDESVSFRKEVGKILDDSL